jgi:hypothetical protein
MRIKSGPVLKKLRVDMDQPSCHAALFQSRNISGAMSIEDFFDAGICFTQFWMMGTGT